MPTSIGLGWQHGCEGCGVSRVTVKSEVGEVWSDGGKVSEMEG